MNSKYASSFCASYTNANTNNVTHIRFGGHWNRRNGSAGKRGSDCARRMNYFFFGVDAHDEVERRVSAVDDFVVAMIDEGALRVVARETLSHEFTFKRSAFRHRHLIIVLCESEFK